jgi:DNA-binding NarL/FixJ family response regulator
LERIRIVLVDMPPLLREIVREAVAPEQDLDVIAEHESVTDLGALVARHQADFVIVGTDAAADSYARAVVRADDRVRALEMRADGRESVLYELRPHRVPLGEISKETLLRTIRAIPRWETGRAEETSERRTV